MIKKFLLYHETGYQNKEKLNSAVREIKSQGAKIIIGPISFQEFEEVKKYDDIIFISLSNITPEFSNNIISIGVSLESQLTSIFKFLRNQKN